jgi:PAS domain S-box-containing protein
VNRLEHVDPQSGAGQEEERFRHAVLAAGDAVYDWDVHGGHVWRNEVYRARYGESCSIAAGAPWWEPPAHPEDRDAIVRSVDDAFHRRRPSWSGEYRLLGTDGEYASIIDRGRILYDHEGRPCRMIGVIRGVTGGKPAEQEHREHLWFLECMDRINRAIQGASDLEQMMSDVLDEVLAIFGCDRVWLTYPCDPKAVSFRVPMERTRPEYPGALALGLEVPMDEFSARTCQALLDASGPVSSDPTGGGPLSKEWGERFRIRSQLAMAIHPKTDNAYAFGMHQCSRPRLWTLLEERAFLEIGRRLADALTSLLAHRSLRESEAKLAEAERISHLGYWELDVDTGRITWSDEAYRIVGLPPQAGSLDLLRIREMVHPEDGASQAALSAALVGGPRFDARFRVVRSGGEVRWVHSQGDLRVDEAGRRRMFGTVQDVTDRARVEQALRDNQNFLRAILDNSSAIIYVKDLDGRYLLINRRFETLFHVDRSSAAGKTDYDVFPAERADAFREYDRSVVEAGEPLEFEEIVPQDDGLHTYVSTKSPLLDSEGRTYAVCGISTDITERKRIEEETRISLREKEALLKEVHHRVKNNLQIISSLLTLQSRHVADPTAREVLAESQGRVRSMALVHEALYRSPSLANVEIAPYIESLCAHLYRSYGIDSRRIALRIAVPELTLDLDRAIPCGLLINELVSNALKHAFPGDRPGSISVAFLADDGGAYRLVVADDGVGLPADLDVCDAPSLGLQLVSSLTDQLRGALEVDSAHGTGTSVAVSFAK